MVARQYSNIAVQTTLSGDISSGQLTMVVGSTSGYPSPSVDKPFTVRINPGQPTEEIVDVVGGAGTAGSPWQLGINPLTGSRAQDDTLSRAWATGTPVVHGFSARDFREVQETLGNAKSLISNALPVGAIILWYGPTASIPNGFRLCNGLSWKASGTAPQNDQATDGAPGSIKTPDLTDRFVLGAGGVKSPGNSGGPTPSTWSGTVTLLAANMPAVSHQHTDSFAITLNGAHTHSLYSRAAGAVNGGSYNVPTTSDAFGTSSNYTAPSGAHTHTISGSVLTTTTGFTTPTPVQTAPPWYALAYIMKVA